MGVALAAAAAAGFVLAFLATGSRREARARTAQVSAVLGPAVIVRPSGAIDESEALPPPVARYLRWALPDATLIHSVRLTQSGSLRTDLSTDHWMPFTAEHVAAPRPPGFVWNARVRVAPLLHVQVRDAYLHGVGAGHVSLQSALPVGRDAGTPEMNAGALHRFLAEAVWYPTALLPDESLAWTAIDANRALATLTDHGTTVSLEFRFADTGEVTGIYTPARWGTFEGGYQQRPWEGHFRDYQQQGGMRVPAAGQVGWYDRNRLHLVWKGVVDSYSVRKG